MKISAQKSVVMIARIKEYPLIYGAFSMQKPHLWCLALWPPLGNPKSYY